MNYDIAKLDLNPGDILVVKVRGDHPAKALTDLREQFMQYIPGIQVMVIDQNIDLSVLSAEKIKALTSNRSAV